MALVTRNTVSAGRRCGLATVAGIMTGVFVHGVAAALGLSAVIAASSKLFNTLRIVGAVYLVWLGVQAWRSAGRPPSEMTVDDRGGLDHGHCRSGSGDRASDGMARPFRHGLVTNVLNPKLVVFFITFVPQFVDPIRGPRRQIALLSLVFMGLAAIWLTGYVTALNRMAGLLSRPSVRSTIDRVSGSVLIALGVSSGLASGPP